MNERRTARAAQRCTEVIDIARRVLIDEGLDRFVMRRIADLAEMQLGNLQYYFPTRDDLLEAVVRAEFAGDVTAVESLRHDDPERHLTDALSLLSRRWEDSGSSVYLALAVLGLHHDRFARVKREIYDQFYAVVVGIIGRIDPDVPPVEATSRAVLITSLVDGASLQHVPSHAARSRLTTSITRLAASIARGETG